MSSLKISPRSRLSLETLEGRSLMAAGITATFDRSTGVLTVVGTEASEEVVVYHENSTVYAQPVIKVLDGASSYYDWRGIPRSQVTKVEMHGLGGDDYMWINETSRSPSSEPLFTVMYGGKGTDTMHGGSGPDHMHGDEDHRGHAAADLDRTFGLRVDPTGVHYNYLGRHEKWVQSYLGWLYITPDGALHKWIGSFGDPVIGQLNASFYEDLTRLTEAHDAPLVYSLDQARNFSLTGNEWLNHGGRNEKWIQSNQGWHFITPDGSLYKWDAASAADGPLAAKLDPAYYQNLSRLVDVANPTPAQSDDDFIHGHKGWDRLFGGRGLDELHGGEGNDVLEGGTGDGRPDVLYGNGGADVFRDDLVPVLKQNSQGIWFIDRYRNNDYPMDLSLAEDDATYTL